MNKWNRKRRIEIMCEEHFSVPWHLCGRRHEKNHSPTEINFVLSCCVIFHCHSTSWYVHSKVSYCVIPLAAPRGWRWQQSAEKEETEPGLPAALHCSKAGYSAWDLHSGWWEEIQWLLQQTSPWPAAVSLLCHGWPDRQRVCEWPLCIYKDMSM